VLFSPDRHEPICAAPWDEGEARTAISRIADRTERELDRVDGRWPLDAADADEELSWPASGLYLGAAGVVLALDLLGRPGDPGFAERLEAKLLAQPDDADIGGLLLGIPGVLALAERLNPEAARRDRLAAMIADALDHPALEPLYGHPGLMLLAAALHERTAEDRWADLWRAGAERLLDTWRFDEQIGVWLWTQDLAGWTQRYVGAGHGLAGNLHVLLSAGLLDCADHALVEQRALDSLAALAVVEGDRANWPPVAGEGLSRNDRIRVQWCHGAPGVLTGLARAGAGDDRWSELMLAAGALVWEAGPLRDAPGLCHGTAGSAFALLALHARTGDPVWLQRARALALHATGQVEARAARLGHGRHSLFTGDEGVAVALHACLEADPRMPVLDALL
jgi:hypothetical protein